MSQPSQAERSTSRDLFSQTLRMIALLVGACVLFVGSLSTVAVVIASKAATGTSGTEGVSQPVDMSSGGSSTPPKPASTTPRALAKSQSI